MYIGCVLYLVYDKICRNSRGLGSLFYIYYLVSFFKGDDGLAQYQALRGSSGCSIVGTAILS